MEKTCLFFGELFLEMGEKCSKLMVPSKFLFKSLDAKPNNNRVL
jgi:hypothetical protein